MRTTLMGNVLVLALLASGCGVPLETEESEATEVDALQGAMSTTANAVDFAFTQSPGQEYIIRLTEPSKVAQARYALANYDGYILVTGKIKKSKVAYNSKWSYFLDPTSIQLLQDADPTCMYNMQYVEDNLSRVGKSMLPDSVWCAGGSRLTREIQR